MAPPPGVDPWLAGRRFGIVIDAGSSGSRLQIYSWKDPRGLNLNSDDPARHTLPKVEKGAKAGEEWFTKVEPGISSFADNPEGVAAYLAPLLRHARDHIPPSLQVDTPLFLLATAGMRLLAPERQADVLRETCLFLRSHSHFRIDGPSEIGPCGSSVRIITGEEEGLFGWIAVNYLMDGFIGSSDVRTTYGFLDMGGASTQIAFEPSESHRGDSRNLVDVRLRLLGGDEIHHQVFVTTWLGYGTNQARERYVGQVISEYEQNHAVSSSLSSTTDEVIPDPCLPKSLLLTEHSMHIDSSTAETSKSHKLQGTGSFSQCMLKTSPLLNKNAPCPDSPCLFNGAYVPPIDFSVSHFIGVSEYWYSSEHVFGLGGAYDYVQYERAAEQFCGREWSGIVKEHEDSRTRLENGGVQGAWGDQVELSRLEMQCFKAAWIANVLHEGIGMPRIVDPGGNSTSHEGGDAVVSQAESKGLGNSAKVNGRPTFQSIDTVGDIAISWTLGKMVLEASKDVPPLLKTDKPIVDPIDNIPDSENPPFKPIRPSFLPIDLGVIEDKISKHLPSSLSRTSLGFSPILFSFYALIFCGVILMAFRLCRRQFRTSRFRLTRSSSYKRDTMMEEGTSINGDSSRPSSPISSTPVYGKWLDPLRRMIPPSRPKPPPLTLSNVHNNQSYHYNHRYAPPKRMSPIRSHSLPSGLGNVHAMTTSANTSRSPSPLPSPVELNSMSLTMSSPKSSRSRNASQINLGTLVPRGAISRVNSMAHVNGGMVPRDE